MTNWSDPELNPSGLRYIDQMNPRDMYIHVALKVKVHAYFETPDGHIYACVFVDETRKREVFLKTEDGFLEVTDPEVKFIVGKWTNEIIDARRN